MIRPLLKDILDTSFPSVDVGFFKVLYASQDIRPEWLTESDAQYYDNYFVFSHSGEKKISNMMLRYYNHYHEETPLRTWFEYVVRNIYPIYKDKWDRLYTAMVDSEYNPLENYDMEEVETPDVTKEKTVDVKTKMVTSSSGDSSSGVYGFNSPTSVPSTENEANTEVTVEGNNLDNVSHDLETETGTRELTRHGNIGVTTSQQMLESELNLGYWNIYEKITDIFLTEFVLPIY